LSQVAREELAITGHPDPLSHMRVTPRRRTQRPAWPSATARAAGRLRATARPPAWPLASSGKPARRVSALSPPGPVLGAHEDRESPVRARRR
jgi:hypothetical protein